VRSLLFWDVTQCWMVVANVSGQTVAPICEMVRTASSATSLTKNQRSVRAQKRNGCSETLVSTQFYRVLESAETAASSRFCTRWGNVESLVSKVDALRVSLLFGTYIATEPAALHDTSPFSRDGVCSAKLLPNTLSPLHCSSPCGPRADSGLPSFASQQARTIKFDGRNKGQRYRWDICRTSEITNRFVVFT